MELSRGPELVLAYLRTHQSSPVSSKTRHGKGALALKTWSLPPIQCPPSPLGSSTDSLMPHSPVC